MRDAGTGVGLGEHDVVGADALQDAPVLGGDRLGPDLGRPHVDEVAGDEHAGLERRADADDGDGEVACAELVERDGVRGVGLDERQLAAPLGDEVRVALDGEHVLPEAVQRGRDRGAEPPEPDDEDAAVLRLVARLAAARALGAPALDDAGRDGLWCGRLRGQVVGHGGPFSVSGRAVRVVQPMIGRSSG